jgi:hypothetical protein
MHALVWLAMTAALPAAPPAPEAPRAQLLVPAYFYPAGARAKDWDRLFAAADKVPVMAIVNPASGPGKAVDDNYATVFARARRSSITLLGYVSTNYAKRPLGDVKADVDTWLALYPNVKGIFVDQQASAADAIDYYDALYKYVRTARKLRLVVTNPGTICAEEYFTRPALDVGCLFEGMSPADGSTLPSWKAKVSRRIAVIEYKVATAAAMQAGLKELLAKKIGHVFITDGDLPNPYDHLPPYWEAEVAAVREASPGP